MLWRDNLVVAGNHTIQALRLLNEEGWTPTGGITVEGDEWLILHGSATHLETWDEALAYAIADNETARRAARDENLLAQYIREMPADLLEATALGREDVTRLLDQLSIDTDELLSEPGLHAKVEAANELREKWQTECGQLWTVGQHRLLCGDATAEADVLRLMQGERATLFATDPPYLIEYDGADHLNGNVDWATLYKDGQGEEDTLYDGFIRMAIDHAVTSHAAWYCWHASRRQAFLEAAWERHGAFVHQQIIWAKNQPVLTRSDYLWAHEPCFYGWVRGQRPKIISKENARTVWHVDCIPTPQLPNHPTPKPIELFALPMRMHTERGEICYEPFAGSGTQYVAAEQLGRRCFGLEKEPAFVAVILDRLTEMGLIPRLEEAPVCV
ncbi:MAG: DNA methyltransferase [Bacteroidota bacterium]